jgi:hypothetical protein
MATTGESTSDLPLVLTQLLKGVVYQDAHEKQWARLLSLRSQVSDYFSVIGLRLIIDEAEGYAYLRSVEPVDGADPLPRLVARRSLSFHVSLLLALLRKKLAEFDAANAGAKLVISRDQIIEMFRTFVADSSNEVALGDQIDAHINKIVDLGFLRRLAGQTQVFEVRRIIKAYIDGQWLSEFDARLTQYHAIITGANQ